MKSSQSVTYGYQKSNQNYILGILTFKLQKAAILQEESQILATEKFEDHPMSPDLCSDYLVARAV